MNSNSDNSYVPAEYVTGLTKKRFEVILKHFANKIGSDDLYESILKSKPNFSKRVREGCYKILAVKRANTSKVTLRYLAENELWLFNTDKYLFEFESDTYDDSTVDSNISNDDFYHTTNKPFAIAFSLFYLIYNILLNREAKKTMTGSEKTSLAKFKMAYTHISNNTSLEKLFNKVNSYVLKDGYKNDTNCLKELDSITTEDAYASGIDLDSIYNV